jgi:RNA-directed DNA polymerase
MKLSLPSNCSRLGEYFEKENASEGMFKNLSAVLRKNVFELHRELKAKAYKHGPYHSFFICDPKVRHIRKACVRDRLVHQSVYTVLTQIFEPKLIHHLYSARIGKGTHRAVKALREMALKVSRNNTRHCWGLKCDVRKFYDTVDHEILFEIITRTVRDPNALWLIREIIESYHLEGTPGKGMPIGNLTSQIFTNVYLNELDQFIKHKLRVKYYLRYADDLLALSDDKRWIENLTLEISAFLKDRLLLELHPKKVIVRPLHQGIDFLGYVTLPEHRVLRTKTKRRMQRKLSKRLDSYFTGKTDSESMNQTLQSYLGILSHADTFKLGQHIRNVYVWQ